MPSQPIHVAANGKISLFFTPHLLYPSSVHGHLDCFHVLAISFHFFWIGTPRMQSLVHMVILCLVWRPLSAAVHSGRTISHSPQPWTRSAVSPHPHQDLFTVFFDTYVHTGNLHKTFTAASLTTGGNNPEACGLWMDEHTVVCPYNGVFVIQPYTGLKYPTHVQHGEPWKQARWKKPDIKHHLLHGSIYMKCPKQANPWDRK